MLTRSMLSVPLLKIDSVLENIVSDSDSIELQLSQATTGTGTFHPSMYLQMIDTTPEEIDASPEKERALSPHSVRVNGLEAMTDEKRLALPDITYDVRRYGDFIMIPGDHFKPVESGIELSQLPVRTRALAKWLIKEKSWIIQTLSEAYQEIGKEQAGFMLVLDPRRFNVLTQLDLVKKLGNNYSPGTYSRLFKNKTVRINAPNDKTAVLPVGFLLPNGDNIRAYNAIPNLNAYFEQEIRSGDALSDENIANRVGGLARRTVTKYRNLAGIPHKFERKGQYASYRTDPFRIATAVESYLPV